MIIGNVGELQAAGHVADRKDTAVGGDQPAVDLDAARVRLHAGNIQPETVGVGLAAGGDKQMGAAERRDLGAVVDLDGDEAQAAADADDFDSLADVEPFSAQVAQGVLR